jgi:hypothetical protein
MKVRLSQEEVDEAIFEYLEAKDYSPSGVVLHFVQSASSLSSATRYAGAEVEVQE